MDVRINKVTSNIQVADSRVMLSPEVLDQVVQAVLRRIEEEEQRRRERERDQAIDTRAAELDRVMR